MNGPFNISDKVVCVNDVFGVVECTLHSSLPVLGSVYVVRAVGLADGNWGVHLVGITGKMGPSLSGDIVEYGFLAKRFALVVPAMKLKEQDANAK